MRDIREEARAIFMAGVAAADPFDAVARTLADRAQSPALILAVGKAARRMAEAALARFPGTPCLVVTNDENARALPGAQVLASGHPVPDARGAAAAETVIRAVQALTGPLLVLVSGGGSALLPAPVAGVSLQDKAEVSRLLLASGADIRAMNLVRQNLSRLKGGGLARLAAPHPVTALILSDVVGDDLSTIASGPTVAPLGGPAEARAALVRFGIWDRVPAPVRTHLGQAAPAGPLPPVENQLIGSNAQSLAAMAAASPGARVISRPIEGDVAAAARAICDAAGPGVTLWGGETTVVLRGQGRGGRNQELSLRIAAEAARRGWPAPWACLQGGSDGRDGPTDAAGGLVDDGTLGRIAAAGLDLDRILATNDSYTALAAAGDLLMTGGTGTNVADLGVLIRP
ncbi:MAG: DUF4147 domain-containing protein [Limimaricola sp.]|uniref:glycerate kinase type-2 family protein n=1 Tax=Limimaricola sp. TaxID=2211665 RepID=UPI001E0E58F9|nr:DUF4147 domain-containing protein [Limimaricola sp.]MBI1418615.1 DUF4147 domain-containing protein [Limimaricola sp.]